MNSILCKDGAVISISGNNISVSTGEFYNYSAIEHILTGNTQSFFNINNIHEAIGIITGLHGGKQI